MAAAIGLGGAALALALPPAGVARADAPAPGGAIPFSVADPATTPRPVVTVSIGGVPLLLLLDTGSTGIRVSSEKVPAKAVTVTGAAAPYGYGSGVRLHGDRADADVVIGGYHTGRLPIELVRSTDCFPDKRSCPAADGAKPAMFGGVLDGVMGVGPEAAAGLVNPMWTLQDAAGNHVGRQFAVRFVPEEFSGAVLLNVPAAGYGLVQLPLNPRTAASRNAFHHDAYDARLTGILAAAGSEAPSSWNPRAVQTCLTVPGMARTCAPAMFDSGTPNFSLDVPGAAAGVWPAGRTVGVDVPQAGWAATFTSGPGTGVAVSDSPSTATGGTLLGLPAFAKGPIRFDLAAGTVGFPVRTPSPSPVGRSAVHDVPASAPPVAEHPAPGHVAQHPAHDPVAPKKPEPKRPFHETAKKAARLPETGVPMSAALGAVTALTALLAGIGTVLAARRRPDREA